MPNTFIQNATLLRCDDKGPTVTVPEGVRIIGTRAFRGKPREIILPEGVETIRQEAFADLGRLHRITLPSSLRSLHKGCFQGCFNLEEIVLPPSIVRIPDCAFQNCRGLRRVEFPEGLHTIGKSAFLDCRSLETLALPASLKTISCSAFANCDALRDVTLPPSVTSLPREVFWGTPLRAFRAPGLNDPAALDDWFCSYIERFVAPCLSIRSIPTHWKRAAMLGFAEWEYRGGTTDPEIRGEYIRYLRARRRALLDDALRDTPLLTLMVRENVLTPELTDLLLEKAAKGERGEATALLLDYRNRAFGEPDPEREARRMMRALNRDGVTIAEFRAAWRARKQKDGSLTLQEYLGTDNSVVVPAFRGKDPVSTLGKGLFKTHPDLLSISLPEGVRTIEENAFADCPSLRRADLPESLQSVGERAFRNCTALEEICLPDSVSTLDDECFRGCSALRRVQLPAGLRRLGSCAFADCEALEEVVCPEGLEEIRPGAFQDCPNLRRLKLPSTLRLIFPYAFARCVSLTEIELPAGLQCLDSYAFFGCAGLIRVCQPSRKPDSPETWERHAFMGCTALREVRIPAQLKGIEGGLVSGCTALQGWVVDPNNPWLTADGPWLLSSDRRTLVAGAPGISGEAVLPEGIRKVAFQACAETGGITSLVIPASVKYICNLSFSHCDKLRKVTFLGTPIAVNHTAFRYSPADFNLELPKGTRSVMMDFD